MKTKTFLYALTILAFFAIIISSCEKSDIKSIETGYAEDDAWATDLFDDIFTEVEDAMETMETMIYDGVKKSASEVVCKTVSIEYPDDSTHWPRTVTIDYGEGCVGPKDRVRSGKIIIVVNRYFLHTEYSRTVTFDNYFVDGYKIEGTKTVSNEGFNESQNLYFSVRLEDGKVISPEGEVHTKEYNKIREFVKGVETPRFRGDDEYMITGTASGINRDMITYTRTIIEPLHVAFSCKWILSGSVEIAAEGKETAILDYGDGTCDAIATVSIGEESKVINLHR